MKYAKKTNLSLVAKINFILNSLGDHDHILYEYIKRINLKNSNSKSTTTKPVQELDIEKRLKFEQLQLQKEKLTKLLTNRQKRIELLKVDSC